MKRTICLWMVAALVPMAVYADDEKTGELTDPMEILAKVDQASTALQAVKFDVTLKGTEGQAEGTPKIEATYLVTGWSRNGPEKFRIDIKERRRTTMTCHATVGFDGKTYFIVDHRERTATEGTTDRILGTAKRKIFGAMMWEYLAPTPFGDELNAKKVELKGSKEIGGEDCYEIDVVYSAENANKATWFFSKKDFLPRGRIDFVEQRKRTGTRVKMVSNLVANPEITEDTFKMTVPDGYGITQGQ